MDLGLKDRICLVTGSTAGIGLETARLLAAEGARVVVNGRDPDRVEQARAEAGAALGVACDLSEPGAAEALVAETTEATETGTESGTGSGTGSGTDSTMSAWARRRVRSQISPIAASWRSRSSRATSLPIDASSSWSSGTTSRSMSTCR